LGWWAVVAAAGKVARPPAKHAQPVRKQGARARGHLTMAADVSDRPKLLSRAITGRSERYRYREYEFEIERGLGWFCSQVVDPRNEWPMYVNAWALSKRSLLRKMCRVIGRSG
jgi:hypothetical protein